MQIDIGSTKEKRRKKKEKERRKKGSCSGLCAHNLPDGDRLGEGGWSEQRRAAGHQQQGHDNDAGGGVLRQTGAPGRGGGHRGRL